jgi:ATP-dependent RNA helicase DeaD
MLCKAGGIDRDQIGQIRINNGNTHVELTPEGAQRLFEHAENGRLEGSLQAFPLEGIPEREDPGAPPPRERERRERPPASRPERSPERSYERKSDWNPAERPPRPDRPDRGDRPERSERPVGKPYEKRSAPRSDRPREDGDRPAKAPWSGPKGKSFSGPSKGPNKGPGKPKTGGKPAGGKGVKPKTFQGLKKPRA